MAHFRRRNAVMCLVTNQAVPFGVLVPYPRSADRPDVYRFDVPYDPTSETLADYPESRCLGLVRAAVGVHDLPITIKTTLAWEMAARVADRFQHGRIFLVGDAARVQPPTGALGGNTGIAEAHNLAWKLAAVLRGEAGAALLDTYDTERRPIADLTVEQVALLAQERQDEQAPITVNTLIVNLGYRYQAGALLPKADADLPLMQDPLAWRGEPGTRAAHLALERAGQRISTLDLFCRHFVLLLGPDVQAAQIWQAAAHGVADRLKIPFGVWRIGSELLDVNEQFGSAYGLSTTGAALVRPDGFVGWRAQAVDDDPERAIMRALTLLLDR